MTIQEQIKALEATRMAKAARMQEIMQKSAAESRSSDEAEAEEFDTLGEDVDTIDKDLTRLRKLEAIGVQVARALPSNTESTARRGSEARGAGPTIIVKSGDKDEAFPGQNYTRIVIAKALAHINQTPFAHAIAAQRWGKSNPTLVALIKANEVAGGGSGSGEWGAELVQADGRYTGDFIEYLHSLTVYDRLPLREVPANVTIKGQDGAATGYWVGQSKGIPASAADFSAVSLTPLKVAALAVVSNELLRDSSPAAEMLVRDALAKAAAQRIDLTFLSATAASAGVSPAGLLDGVSAGNTAGADADGVIADIKTLYASFISARNASDLAFVMNKSLAKALSLMRNALGQHEFPSITANGGTLEGDPVFTGDNVGAGDFILLKPSDIYRIGSGAVETSISREATIEQNSVPSGASDTPVAAANTLVNMFQTESTAIKVVQSINFAKRRSSAVQYIDDADYGNTTS